MKASQRRAAKFMSCTIFRRKQHVVLYLYHLPPLSRSSSRNEQEFSPGRDLTRGRRFTFSLLLFSELRFHCSSFSRKSKPTLVQFWQGTVMICRCFHWRVWSAKDRILVKSREFYDNSVCDLLWCVHCQEWLLYFSLLTTSKKDPPLSKNNTPFSL